MVDITKELEPGVGAVEQVLPPVEIPTQPEENLEVESWMRKIEKKFARVPNATSDVTDDTVVIQPPQAGQPPVTLPVNQQQMQQGKKAKIDTGLAWLVAWALRQIKLFGRLGKRVRLQDIPEVK
jgi:hypothetical protein